MKPIRRILHATDFSSASRRAFAVAIEFTRQNRGELVLAHVMPAPASFRTSEPPADYLAILGAARRRQARRLDAMRASAQRRGIRVQARLMEGLPAQEIVRAARAHSADLIVVGTHGGTGVSRFLAGSVAERVLQIARCPVITVRGRSSRRRFIITFLMVLLLSAAASGWAQGATTRPTGVVLSVDRTAGTIAVGNMGPKLPSGDSRITPYTIRVTPSTELVRVKRIAGVAPSEWLGDYVETKLPALDIKPGDWVTATARSGKQGLTATSIVVVDTAEP